MKLNLLLKVICMLLLITQISFAQKKAHQHEHKTPTVTLDQTKISLDESPAHLINKFRTSNKFRSSNSYVKARVEEPICQLLAADYEAESYVAPPANFVKKQADVSRNNDDCSNVIVTYNFPPFIDAERRAQFVNAYEYAAAIWESQLSSPVTIRVQANFLSLDPGVLGSAGPVFIWNDGVGGPWYGEALFDEITGVDSSGPGTPDINSNFNTDFGWYLGTDGNPPPGTYDFVTVVLHELGHGLGFFGNANAAGQLGVYGFQGLPFIYETSVQDGNGTLLTDIAPPSTVSTALGPVLQGNNLFIKSPSLTVPEPIYAINPFRRGSSFSHWDEASFPAGTPNSLMTPQLGFQEAIHDPGPNTIAMFNDHGWDLAENCDAPTPQDLSENCNITGISPDPNFPPFLCDNPGVFSPDGGVFGPVGSHVMCFRVEGIDPLNQPLDASQYQVKIGGKDYPIVFLGYDFFEGEQYLTICVGGIASTGRKNVPVKIKLAPGCTFTQGRFYTAPTCQEELSEGIVQRSLEINNTMALSPNPVEGQLYIDLDIDEPGKILIQDFTGRTLKAETNAGQGRLTLDVSNYTSGIYFATYISENRTITEKFIKR